MTPIEIQLAIHSYSFVQHFQLQPGFSVFDFIDRSLALGFTGVNINLNRPDWRHLTGQSPEHVTRVRRYLRERGLSLELDTSGTAPAHLQTMLSLARAHKLSAYDAAYLELALRRGLPLATLDDKLKAAAQAVGVAEYAP